jgi:hypothetical protein
MPTLATGVIDNGPAPSTGRRRSKTRCDPFPASSMPARRDALPLFISYARVSTSTARAKGAFVGGSPYMLRLVPSAMLVFQGRIAFLT